MTSSIPEASEPATPPQGFRVVLPASWWVLDLDPATRARSINELVTQSLPPGRFPPRVRRQTEAGYHDLIRTATAQGAFFGAVLNDVVADLPVSASLLVFRRALGVGPDGAPLHDPEAMAAALATSSTASEEILESSVEQLRCGPVVRLRALVSSGITGSTGASAKADTLRVFAPVPGEARMLVLAFSTPILSLGDQFTELFDGIAASLEIDAAPDASPAIPDTPRR